MASSGSSTAGAEQRPSLGLCVTTTGCSSIVQGLAVAAESAGVRLELFLTGEGVELLRDAAFPELVARADRVGVCEVSARQRGIPPEAVASLRPKDFVTQARNAELVDSCDRYLGL